MKSKELGMQAVQLKHWRWLPGMMVHGVNPETNDHAWLRLRELDNGRTVREQLALFLNPYPDLGDSATIGCLLRLTREAWDDDWMGCLGSYNHLGGVWTVYGGKPHGSRFMQRIVGVYYDSEAEALIAALEAAP